MSDTKSKSAVEDHKPAPAKVLLEAITLALDAGVLPSTEKIAGLQDALDVQDVTDAAALCDRLRALTDDDLCIGEHADVVGAIRTALEPADRTSLYASWDELVANFKPTEWTVRDLLPRRGVGFFVAPSKGGKTFTCIDLAGHLAQGRDWLGHKVKQRWSVLYVTGEGRNGLNMRLVAWSLKHGSVAGAVGVMQDPPNLFTDPKAAKKIVAAVRALERKTGLPCACVILDTMASLCAGMSENDGRDMGVVFSVFRNILRSADCAVMAVHHTGWSDTTRARGHSSILGNGDFELMIKREGSRRWLKTTKERDAEENDKGIPFRLERVKVGEYDDGDPISSLVFTPETTGAAMALAVDVSEEDDAPDLGQGMGQDDAQSILKPHEQRVLDLVYEADRPMSASEIQLEYNRRLDKTGRPIGPDTVLRILNKLRGAHVEKDDNEARRNQRWFAKAAQDGHGE